MPYQNVPGAKGVKWRPASEALADPEYEWVTMPDGTIQGRKKPGWLTRNAPWLMGAAMGAGGAYNLLAGAAASGGGAAGAAGAGGAVPNYVPASMIGMGLPGGVAQSGADFVRPPQSGADFLGPRRRPDGNRVRDVAQDVARKGLNWWQQAALAAMSGVPALVAASRNRPSAEELALQQQIRDMLAGQQRRFEYQNPLFESVSRLAMSRLPTANQRPLAENL